LEPARPLQILGRLFGVIRLRSKRLVEIFGPQVFNHKISQAFPSECDMDLDLADRDGLTPGVYTRADGVPIELGFNQTKNATYPRSDLAKCVTR
jgi:hypothetical protein